MIEKLDLPQGVSVGFADGALSVKGPKGELARAFPFGKISIKIEGSHIILSVTQGTKREKCLLYSIIAHIKNMVAGVQNPFVYELKVCSGHFPMNVDFKNNVLSVKNFLGEKVPRTLKVKEGAKVVVAGDKITIECIDIELAGKIASDIEHICRITNRDRRIFQDGIYIT